MILMIGILISVFTSVTSDSLVRGVSLKEQGFYDSTKDFTCFDGSKIIPFESVNDDYCDCVDGSDEPGTSACPDGKYYCQNLGHKAMYIQSSRVNDGICDCCDGSDEYDSSTACFNECQKQGQEELIRLQKEHEEQNAGFEVRKGYITTGSERKREKKARADTLNQLLEERRTKLEQLKSLKEAAEAPEKEAKEKHENEWKEEQAKRKEEQEKADKIEAYAKLDLDKNGWIAFAELMAHPNLNADMTENDAKDILGGEAMVDADGFEKVWPTLKDKYLKNGRPQPAEEVTDTQGESEGEGETEAPPVDVPPAAEETTEAPTTDSHTSPTPEELEERVARNRLSDYDDEDHEDDDEDEDDLEGDADLKSSGDGHDDDIHSNDDAMPAYDEATQALISAADKVRQEFNEADREVKELESENNSINDYLNVDFGQEDEFAALKGECFEFTDREYTYKLCPFDRVTQRQKSGGSETALGNWGQWVDGYNKMKYTGGQGCWNGPARSTLVRMSCGRENLLLSVSEPSRCEYEMEFKTPALCMTNDGSFSPHTEL